MKRTNRELEQQLTLALAAPPQSRTAAVPETLLHRCRAAYHPVIRAGAGKSAVLAAACWGGKPLGWKLAALALYSVGRALGLWVAA